MDKQLTFEQLPEAVNSLKNEFDELKKIVIDGFKSTKPDPTERYLTIEQAGELLKLSKHTLYSKVCRNELPHMKRGKRLYFSENDLIEYISGGRRLTNAEISQQADNYLKRKGGRA